MRHYTNYKELLKEKLDVLIVAMTNDIAPDVTIEALHHGLHVFCEKPPGCTLNDIIRVKVERDYPHSD